MKISKLFLVVMFMMTSCQTQKDDSLALTGFEAIHQGDYSIVLPEVHNNARIWHSQVLSERDMMNLGERMQELCKSYYSPQDYVLTPGRSFTRDDIVELQRRASESAPYGMNPEEGPYSISDELILESPYLICDLVELNFISLKDEKITETAVTIVMNSVEGMTDEKLIYAGVDASKILMKYLTDVKGIHKSPLILIYAASGVNGTLPGRFLAVHDGETKVLDEQWVYLPSSAAEELDSVLSYEFAQLKEKVKEFLNEHVDLVGEVFFENNVAEQLKIDVNVQSKTYKEMNALVQCLASSIEEMKITSLTVTCQIRVLDTTLFVLERKQNQDEIILIRL